MNLAQYAEAFAAGKHPGYVPTALDGLRKTLPLISEKGIKVIINGGALNPRGLAVVVQELVLLPPFVVIASPTNQRAGTKSQLQHQNRLRGRR